MRKLSRNLYITLISDINNKEDFNTLYLQKKWALFAYDVLQGKKLQILWDRLDRDEQWVSCECSWHPRILIVANSRAVFLVDLRSDKCNVCTLLNIDEAVSLGRTDRFLALSRVDSDPFFFTAVSGRFLLLCDVRKPLMPLLRWVHGLNNPAYVTVLRLSDLRQHTRNDKWAWATESGRCILEGSFWDCEFALFCLVQVAITTINFQKLRGSVNQSMLGTTFKPLTVWS